MGESPTRPLALRIRPPVLVAAAKLALKSIATAPTVSLASSPPYSLVTMFSSVVEPAAEAAAVLAFQAFLAFNETRLSFGTSSMPWETANRSAPLETKRQCGEFSRTFSAKTTGFFTRPEKESCKLA